MNKFLITFIFLCTLVLNTFASVRFAQISDIHIFEDSKRASETAISSKDFQKSIALINTLSGNPKEGAQEPLDFVVVSGDIGVGKLVSPDPVTGKLLKDSKKWTVAKKLMADIIKVSKVRKWFFLPGNNDLYKERPETIVYFQDFLKELQAMPEVKKAGLTIVDFRLESSQKVQRNSPPGVYSKEDLVFIGWDNSYFKNNNSIKRFIDKNHNLIPYQNTLEYKSLQMLSQVLEASKAKYAYIFFHIPAIDDPYLILFDATKDGNIPYQRMKEAQELSPILAKELYPYSAWTVPMGVRELWENIATNRTIKYPLIKGLFAGHFHDHKKSIYSTTTWNKSKQYQPQILKKLYLDPPVSIKNQTQYPPSQQARGIQIITIDDQGNVARDIIWFDNAPVTPPVTP